MNRRRACSWALAAAAALAGCAALPQQITLSEAELQAQLARRFPVQRSVLELIDLQLSDPQLRLDAASNRLSTELTLRALERRGSGRSLQGRLALDYGLRWEPADASVRLVDPRVAGLQFEQLPEGWARRAELLQRMAAPLAERLLDDLVLYRVPDQRLRALRAAGLQPGELKLTPAGLQISIEPLR